MSLQGGPSFHDLEPLLIDRDELGRPTSVGCHRGAYEALNVRNAQPGMIYYYAARRRGVLRFLNRGWEVVLDSDPERWGAELPDKVQAQLGGEKAFQDVVLVRAPEDLVRAENDEKAAQARAALNGSEQAYFDQGRRVASMIRGGSGKDIYYATREHGLHFEENS